jgi:hypothetical protein
MRDEPRAPPPEGGGVGGVGGDVVQLGGIVGKVEKLLAAVEGVKDVFGFAVAQRAPVVLAGIADIMFEVDELAPVGRVAADQIEQASATSTQLPTPPARSRNDSTTPPTASQPS